MNILLVAYSYPPDPLVGSYRAAKVVEAFRRSGHHVDVVTARLPGEEGSLRVSAPGLHVHTVRCIPNPRHLYVWAKSRLGGKETDPATVTPPADAKLLTAAAEQTPTWKRLLLSALWLPDDLQGFIIPTVLRSIPLLRRGVDLIYTTAPPFSGHLAGLILKTASRVRWAAEFRDPWTDNPERSPRIRSRPADAMNAWLERRCLTAADHVVAVAPATRDALASKLSAVDRARLIVALNGIDQFAQPELTPSTDGPFRVVYTGSFYSGRDPRSFLEALASLRQDLALDAEDIQVEFIGSQRYHGIPLKERVHELGLSGLVRFLDWMPQDQCRARMQQADLLLLLFRDHRIQIPNKLYDYLGSGRPILALVDPEGEVARMLRQVGGHYLVTDSDPASMERALKEAFMKRSKDDQHYANGVMLGEWSTENQMQRLLEALGVNGAGGSGTPIEPRSAIVPHLG